MPKVPSDFDKHFSLNYSYIFANWITPKQIPYFL